MAGLKYFRVMQATLRGIPVEISRTGYTGDLGYEIWVAAEQALAAVGRAHGGGARRTTSRPPACWRSTWRASRRG